MGEVRLYVLDEEEEEEEEEVYLYSASEIICCRICHEAEFETCKSLEAPCSCSGTVKFAHRDCIQRWCDEKGNTICEICLQKFEPGYSAAPPPTKAHDTAVTIQGSVEVVNPEMAAEEEERLLQTEYADCSSAADRSAAFCRFLAFIFTMLLLVRHLFAACIGGTGDYPFTLLTLVVIRASGILLPMYIIMRMIDAIHKSTTNHYPDSENGMLSLGA